MSRDALVVGINTYTNLPKLSAPMEDAEAIAQRLEQTGNFQVKRLPEIVSEGNLRVGKQTQVSLKELQEALVKLFKPESTQVADTALFYFSGHGLRIDLGVQEGFLATSDINPACNFFGLSLRWLRQLLEESPIRQQIIWLDCCHSGTLINIADADPGERGKGRDRCFIAASRDFETAWQDISSHYSVLTQALLEGLDPSRCPDRWVTNYSLVDFLNQRLQGATQRPTFSNFGEPINLTRIWQATSPIAVAPSPSDICPYKGLRYFDCNEEDPKYFYGRNALIDQLLDQVRQSNFVAIVGASGSGKSSVLRAGLLYQLKQGRRLSGSDHWQMHILLPGEHPLQALAQAFVEENISSLDRAEQLGRAEGLLKAGADGLRRLVQVSAASRVVVVVDQFEEVFTLCQDATERQQFFECLLGALEDTPQLCLILAMRADFFGKCLEQEYSGLADRIRQNLTPITPMTSSDLEVAITKPAEQVNLMIEPELVSQMIQDVQGEPGNLPLLQYTLTELWKRRSDNQLKLNTYTQLGGVSGTLQQRATAVYEQLSPEQQQTAKHIFLSLTQLGDETADTRRRVLKGNLATPQHPVEQIDVVVKRLADENLIVTSEVIGKGETQMRSAVVDVAHEALIRHWTLLRQWLEVDRAQLRQKQRIETAAEEWQDKGKKPDDLWQGKPLLDARRLNHEIASHLALSNAARDFIQRSLRQQFRNRLKLASWLIIPAVAIGLVGEHFWREESVKQDYYRIDTSEGGLEERQAVLSLVKGCDEGRALAKMPFGSFITERLFGNCRLLYKASLDKAELSSADLRSANLSSANLSSANLSDAYLRSAELSSANLRSAELSSANLSFVNLNNANLSSANLSNADLRVANLSFAYLRSADLNSAYIRDADLNSTDLRSANLSNADLSNADLNSADLRSANLSNADLSNADLISANLSNADLSNADLISANLSNAKLEKAVLFRANLRGGKGLQQSQLIGTDPPLLCATKLPTEIESLSDRDCDRLPQALLDKYPDDFKTLDEAKQWVEEQRKEWP
ncbi:MAG TPA: pentapeptide repeat-containing protein [Coleofasciculaceae cyanobacterium]|jgi:uncharacterized protein YjbI with pentapeptide repeats/energy-coupling factor transporter ATP-binding protein EcfA2